MQSLKLIVLFGWLSIFSCAGTTSQESVSIEWMTLAQVESSLQKEKRPVLIDLYTDWCGWCKVMDKKTYSNKKVIEYLKQKFYFVKVNAESKQSINWNGRKYTFNPEYRTNEFALYLTQGRLSYPTTVIIPVEDGQPQAIPGFLEPKDFEVIVKYFGEGKYRKVPFPQYQQQFKSSW